MELLEAKKPPETKERVWVDCCGKWRYPTRPVAFDKLLELREQGRTERAVHYCRTCGGWHLTRLLQWEINNNAPDVRRLLQKEEE